MILFWIFTYYKFLGSRITFLQLRKVLVTKNNVDEQQWESIWTVWIAKNTTTHLQACWLQEFYFKWDIPWAYLQEKKITSVVMKIIDLSLSLVYFHRNLVTNCFILCQFTSF